MLTQPDMILRYGKENSEPRDFRVNKEDIMIGRASECDIQLDDQQVSRFHASFRLSADGMSLLDMDSRNGTMIEQRLIPPNQRIPLLPEQKFSIGEFVFQPMITIAEATIIKPVAASGYMYDLEALRGIEFPRMVERVYLNNAGGAPAPQRTVNKMAQVLAEKIATARWLSGTYPLELLRTFTTLAAAFVNAESSLEITFIHGASAGLNLVAQSLVLKQGDNIVFCDLEHQANVYCWMGLQRDGVVVKQVPSASGGLTLETLQAEVNDRTRVVAASAVQFFSGHRTDLAAIGKFCRDRNIVFVVDATQAVGHMPINVRKMNIDVLVTGGHKSLMTAPGSGFLYVRGTLGKTLRPRPLGALSSADWPYSLNDEINPRSDAERFLIGTPNIMAMAGMIESMALLNELSLEAIERHTTRLAARALQLAQERGFELTTTVGEHGPIAAFKSKLGKEETRSALAKLEQKEGMVIARQLDRQGNTHLRLSFHCYNSEAEIERAVDLLEKLV